MTLRTMWKISLPTYAVKRYRAAPDRSNKLLRCRYFSLQDPRADIRETLLSSLIVINEAGEAVETITQRVKEDNLPTQPQDPVSLIERLILERNRERKAAKEDQPSTSTWANIFYGN